MPAQRKLFLAHASELAHRMVRTVVDGGLIARFVRSYSERYSRPGLPGNPDRARELDATLGREALLVMAVEIRRVLPAAFGQTRSSKSRSSKSRNAEPDRLAAGLADAFYAEFLASLGRSLDWAPAEAVAEMNSFLRDLEMYESWNVRSASRLASRPAKLRAISIAPGDSPFADRCALLLDPSLMEQARRAAAIFEIEIARTGTRLFSQLGRHPLSRKSPPRFRRRRSSKISGAAARGRKIVTSRKRVNLHRAKTNRRNKRGNLDRTRTKLSRKKVKSSMRKKVNNRPTAKTRRRR